MNFDVFKKITFTRKDELLEHCFAAERSIYTDPYSSVSSSRSALEMLCSGLLQSRNIPVEATSRGDTGLVALVETCYRHYLLQSTRQAHNIRKSGNEAVHNQENATVVVNARLSESLHVITEANISTAAYVVDNLYQVMQQAFNITKPGFDRKKIPFGEFEILRAIPKDHREIIVGEFNYFVKNASGNCYYWQIFPKNAGDAVRTKLTDRNKDAAAIVRDDPEPKMYLKNAQSFYSQSAGADREYVAYQVHEKSFMLSELQEPLTVPQAIHVCLCLVELLEEMSQLENGLHHRNINPSSVLLTPSRGRYHATLVNFQTAKIDNYAKTISKQLELVHKANLFAHPDLRYVQNEDPNLDWERADVYSVARILVYCVCPDLLKQNHEMDTNDLIGIFSDEMVDYLTDTFDSSLALIEDLASFKEALNFEAEQH